MILWKHRIILNEQAENIRKSHEKCKQNMLIIANLHRQKGENVFTFSCMCVRTWLNGQILIKRLESNLWKHIYIWLGLGVNTIQGSHHS